MKVSQLIKKLEKLPQDTEVYKVCYEDESTGLPTYYKIKAPDLDFIEVGFQSNKNPKKVVIL